MDTTSRHRFAVTPRRTARRRAVALLEFVMILPMFMFMMLFVIDTGRMMMVSGLMQDATYRAARAGAVYGGGQADDGSLVSKTAFEQALNEMPGLNKVNVTSLAVVRGQVCRPTDPYVEVRVSYTVDMITPGLAQLLSIAGGNKNPSNVTGLPTDGNYNLTATAVARCEVAS